MIGGPTVFCYTQNHTRCNIYNQWLYLLQYYNIITALLVIISVIIGRLPKSLRTIIVSNGEQYSHITTTQQQSSSPTPQLSPSIIQQQSHRQINKQSTYKHRTAIAHPWVHRWPYELPDETGDTPVPATYCTGGHPSGPSRGRVTPHTYSYCLPNRP